MKKYEEAELTHKIIAAAIEVHKNLGPGLLESIYKTCLCFELKQLGLSYHEELAIPVIYKNQNIGANFRIDLLIEDKILVELKAVETLLPVHESQLLSYLRLTNRSIGLLINFNVSVLKKGIKRCVLNAKEIDLKVPC